MNIQIGLEPTHGIFNSETEQWEPGTDGAVSDAQWAEMLRRERDIRLVTSDWTQVPDSPLTEIQKEQWKVYRQVLRDLPATTATLGMVIDFPEEPS